MAPILNIKYQLHHIQSRVSLFSQVIVRALRFVLSVFHLNKQHKSNKYAAFKWFLPNLSNKNDSSVLWCHSLGLDTEWFISDKKKVSAAILKQVFVSVRMCLCVYYNPICAWEDLFLCVFGAISVYKLVGGRVHAWECSGGFFHLGE